MNLTNLDRDQLWALEITAPSTPASNAWDFQPTIRTDGTVHERFAHISTFKNFAGTAGEKVSFGVQFSWTKDAGRISYRVKGASIADAFFFYGWTGGSGSSLTLSSTQVIGTRQCDEIVCVPELSSYSNETLCFGVAFDAACGNQGFSLSVQSLLGKPDPYTSSVR
jgi:hypothetical protein